MSIRDVNLLDLRGNSLETSETHKEHNLKISKSRSGHIGQALLDDEIDIAEALTLAYLQGQYDSALVTAEKALRKQRDEGNDDIIFKA